jgi:hypothetical protein
MRDQAQFWEGQKSFSFPPADAPLMPPQCELQGRPRGASLKSRWKSPLASPSSRFWMSHGETFDAVCSALNNGFQPILNHSCSQHQGRLSELSSDKWNGDRWEFYELTLGVANVELRLRTLHAPNQVRNRRHHRPPAMYELHIPAHRVYFIRQVTLNWPTSARSWINVWQPYKTDSATELARWQSDHLLDNALRWLSDVYKGIVFTDMWWGGHYNLRILISLAIAYYWY